jgi:predicted transcriptional regulator YdeE
VNHKIITKDVFQIIGIEIRTSNQTAIIDLSKLWGKFFAENIKDRIPNKVNSDFLAVYTNYEGNHTKPYTCILCCEVNSLETIPAGMIGKTIPFAKYEVLSVAGKMPDKIVETWNNIWNSDIEKRRAYIADFEQYGNKYGNPENSDMDIYIGIKQ